MRTHRWPGGWAAFISVALVWGEARAESPTNEPPAAPETAGGAGQGTGDFEFILDRIREIEKNHVQREIEMERLQARKTELETQLEQRKRRVKELEEQQAALRNQANAQETESARDPSGWYVTLGPVDLLPASPEWSPKKIPSGQYLRVTGRSAAGARRVRMEGAEYDATPAENLIEDSVMRARLEARRADCAAKGDPARAEQITRVLEHLREQLRDAAAVQVVPDAAPRTVPSADAEKADNRGKN